MGGAVGEIVFRQSVGVVARDDCYQRQEPAGALSDPQAVISRLANMLQQHQPQQHSAYDTRSCAPLTLVR